ncbi:3-keto-disaccharide hydrolase [Lignipirellula cremea]|uniref:3-keto-alpha-glucoside-1,2-lyase/3-keto-2-hydroxy-glucal hydratase domain-containing protein n=1 Tax=Lignipirellula cremea TaxID=2528010 RepID=A0A518DRZ5_9BACT|nr:DUF1080 domain-containing protein [Lignipirellula cremea]QDU94606.1 hypothetical protein Pla8534_23990 [Lignipirellula cremea]
MNRLFSVAVAAFVLSHGFAVAGETYTDPDKTDADFAIQGEYEGKLHEGEDAVKYGVQLIAEGNGKFQAVAYPGGLPGAGWDGNGPLRIQKRGELKDGKVIIEDTLGKGVVENGQLTIYAPGSNTAIGTLKRIQRQSPTLGAKPPQGAVVLYGGPDDVENWVGGKASEEGLLMQGVTSKQKFGDHTLHVEFRLPYQPENRGQGRGNSGLYLQGRYEVQMLDSFGLEGKQNECGGIYSVASPALNMCLPPLTWQTYDVEYTAGTFDDAGKVVKNPRVTVKHNGVVIHDNVELPGERNTTSAPTKAGPEPGPVYLQNHGNPVRYQNIWAVEKK